MPSRNDRQARRSQAPSSAAPGRAAAARAVERTTAVALPDADEGEYPAHRKRVRIPVRQTLVVLSVVQLVSSWKQPENRQTWV